MRWIAGFFIIALIFLGTPAYADWEWWNKDGVSFKVRDKVGLCISSEQKFKNDMSDIYCYNFVTGFDYCLSDWLDLGLNYQYEKQRKYIGNGTWGNWLDEHRIQLEPTLKWKWGKFRFSDRNRVEYRILEARKDKWRYRNRLKVKKSLTFQDIEFCPYCSDEMFFDCHGDGFYKNRFAIGISKDLTSLVCLDIYYLLEGNKNGSHWHHSINVLGTSVAINF